MTTNKISFIGLMFVVGITYLSTEVILDFNTIDLLYLIFIVGCFIKFIYIRKIKE